MYSLNRACNVFVTLLILACVYKGYNQIKIDSKYYLVTEAYNVARNLFLRGRSSYNNLKTKSLNAMDTFLDLTYIMNDEMAKEIRSAILKIYKIKYFQDFTNYVITLEEMVEIIEHCLIGPEEKIEELRNQFHVLVKNFEDIRHFETVYKCKKELPDEVAAAHCILHQAVLFNETMQESLISIVEIKTNQHVRVINSTLYDVQNCLNNLVPKFFEQLLVEAYTDKCGFLKVINASATDLIKDKWRKNDGAVKFASKWNPVVSILKQRSKTLGAARPSLLLALMTANLTSKDLINTIYS